MSKTPTYARFKHPMAANEEITIHATGDLVAALAATGGMEVAFGEGAFIPLDVGQTVSFQEGEGFSFVRVKDTSGAANTVDLYVGRGEFFDLRFSATGTLTTRESAPDTLTTGATVSALNAAATELAAANALRREIMLVNTDAAATVYVGGASGALAGEGIPVLAGQSLTLQSSAAVYARNDSGAPVAVAVAEMEWAA